MMMDVLGYPFDLIDRLVRWADATGELPPELVLGVGDGESGDDPYAVGDGGTSFGEFQLHIPAHGHDRAWWSGVDGAIHGADEMKGRWLQAWRALGGFAVWVLDPGGFLARWWAPAQGAVPESVTEGRARAAAAQAHAVYVFYLKALAVDGTPPPEPTPDPCVDLRAQFITELQGIVAAADDDAKTAAKTAADAATRAGMRRDNAVAKLKALGVD